MRTIFITILLIFFSISIQAQDFFNQKVNQHRNHLLIVHPTTYTLKRYQYLIDEGIINLSELKLVGVYFEDEFTDYSEAIEKYPQIGFHCVQTGLETESIFEDNAVSDEFKKLFTYSKGIIFNGGPDIPPEIYGENKLNLTLIADPWRNYYEISFLYHLLGGSQNPEFTPFMKERPDYMVLGICLGMQSINVASGGTLIQDIPFEVYNKNTAEQVMELEDNQQHRNYHSDFMLLPEIKSYKLHPIKILKGRFLSKIDKKNIQPYVLSSHHQAIQKMGKDLRVTAYSMDEKIIEGIEHRKYTNVIGLQFHPEIDFLYNDSKMYKLSKDEESFSLKQKIKDLNSYDFHVNLWKNILDTMK